MNVLWIPIFSMRSYATGCYSLLKDGNFQLTLSRIAASDYDSITVLVPNRTSDLDELIARVRDAIPEVANRIKFVNACYGDNAVETRQVFWEVNQHFFKNFLHEFDLVVTDVTGFHKVNHRNVPFINNFNITKLPELNRKYIDMFFDLDLESIRAAKLTTVINPRQREYILEVDPSLKDKVVAYTKVASEHFLPRSESQHYLPLRSIFWPFRISDTAYQFDKFIEMFIENKLDKRWRIVITDPNDSYTADHKFVIKKKMEKSEYYAHLQSKPVVVMLDDIDTVLHPGTIEFFYYGCPVITLLNDLVGNKYQVEKLSDIPDMLNQIEYNSNTDISDFVYLKDEKSKIYTKNLK